MKKINIIFLVLGISCLFVPSRSLYALTIENTDQKSTDTDNDGLTDWEEINIYRTDPNNPDTDGDGYSDGDEVVFNYDPNHAGNKDRLEKLISVNLKTQSLTYKLGSYVINTLKVSTGDRKHPTPKGTFNVFAKPATVNYRGYNYYYPNTRWNLRFKTGTTGNYYIHGAYWHNNFGKPVSHGCVNVSYKDMENLYNWADMGTKIIIE